MRNKFIFSVLALGLLLSFTSKVNADTLPATGEFVGSDTCTNGTLVSSDTTDLSDTALPSDIGTPGKYCISETQTTSSKGDSTYQTNVYSYSGNSFTFGDLYAEQTSDGGDGGDTTVYSAYAYPLIQTSLNASPSTIYESATGTEPSSALSADVILGGEDFNTQTFPPQLTCSIDNGVGSYTGSQTGVPPFPVSPTNTTTYTLTCNYNGEVSTSPATVTVVPPLSNSGVMCSVTPTTVNTGQPVTWSANVTSGTPPYTYLWEGDSFLGNATTPSVSGSYSSAGVKNGEVTVTDSSNQPASKTVTPNQTYDSQCTGSSTGYAFIDVDDGDTSNGSGSQNEAVSSAESAYYDESFGPADFHANPQNYCIQEIVNGPHCTTQECVSTVKDVLYSGSGTTSSLQLGTLTWTVTNNSSTAPATVTQMCSNNVTVTGSSAPTPPILSCPTTGVEGQTLSFTMSAVDPNGLNIRYGVDWNNDGTIDQWIPPGTSTSTYLTSGTPQIFTNSWSTPGTYTIGGVAENVDGETSATSTCSVAITSALPDLTAGAVTPSTATAGTPTTLNSTISNSNATSTLGAFPDLFQVATSVAGESSPTNIGTFSNPQLASSGTTNATQSYTFPSAGTYYVQACANENISGVNVVSESNYGNNCSGWTPVTVSAAPGGGGSITSCVVSNNAPSVGTVVTYTAKISGTVTTPYSWTSSNPGMCNTSTGRTETCTYTTPGSYTMTVQGSNTSPATCTLVTAGAGCGIAVPTISANPNLVNPADPSKSNSVLTFNATDVNSSCVLSDPGGAIQTYTANSCSIGGPLTYTVSPTTQTKYCFTCDGGTPACVVVNVVPGYQEF